MAHAMFRVQNDYHTLSCLVTWSPAGGDIWKGCGPFRRWHLARGTGSRREWTLVYYSPVLLPSFSLLPGYRCNVTVCSILVGCYAYPAATMHLCLFLCLPCMLQSPLLVPMSTLPVAMSPLPAVMLSCLLSYLPAWCHVFLS